jgi:glycosyltransferase involved in cell wall biosynthesis
MRIVYLNPVGSLGGGERVLLQILSGVRRESSDWDLTLITMTDGPLITEAEKLGVRSICLPMPASLAGMGDSHYRDAGRLASLIDILQRVTSTIPDIANYIRRLREILRKSHPDLIHSNGIKSHLLSRWVSPTNTPILWHIHDFIHLRPMIRKTLRWCGGKVRGLIAISKAVGDDARVVLPKIPIHVILNATDLNTFQPGIQDGPLLDRLAGISEAKRDTIRIGLIATYARWKGHEVFLRAASQVIPQIHKSIRFYVIGGPIYHTKAQYSQAELQQFADSLGISNNIGFIPFQTETAKLYQSLDIVVHASTIPEPFGLTIAESMACGKATIVSQAGGASELFTHEYDALGVSPGNINELAFAMKRLIEDSDLRHRLEKSARLTAKEKFDSIRYGKEIVALYRQVIPAQ